MTWLTTQTMRTCSDAGGSSAVGSETRRRPGRHRLGPGPGPPRRPPRRPDPAPPPVRTQRRPSRAPLRPAAAQTAASAADTGISTGKATLPDEKKSEGIPTFH